MRQYLIALSALVVAAGSPVAAEDFVVKHADLDLASAKGQKELERRIDLAARTYCGLDAQKTGTRVRPQGARECYRDARAAAREQMAMLVEKSQLGG
jgi:UrcA family protein